MWFGMAIFFADLGIKKGNVRFLLSCFRCSLMLALLLYILEWMLCMSDCCVI